MKKKKQCLISVCLGDHKEISSFKEAFYKAIDGHTKLLWVTFVASTRMVTLTGFSTLLGMRCMQISKGVRLSDKLDLV